MRTRNKIILALAVLVAASAFLVGFSAYITDPAASHQLQPPKDGPINWIEFTEQYREHEDNDARWYAEMNRQAQERWYAEMARQEAERVAAEQARIAAEQEAARRAAAAQAKPPNYDRFVRLADCESGEWDAKGNPIPGSARWHIDGRYDGGLQYDPGTWLDAGGGKYARYAWQATPHQQIMVSIDWLAKTSWAQWPKCSRKLGYR